MRWVEVKGRVPDLVDVRDVEQGGGQLVVAQVLRGAALSFHRLQHLLARGKVHR